MTSSWLRRWRQLQHRPVIVRCRAMKLLLHAPENIIIVFCPPLTPSPPKLGQSHPLRHRHLCRHRHVHEPSSFPPHSGAGYSPWHSVSGNSIKKKIYIYKKTVRKHYSSAHIRTTRNERGFFYVFKLYAFLLNFFPNKPSTSVNVYLTNTLPPPSHVNARSTSVHDTRDGPESGELTYRWWLRESWRRK